MLGYPDQASRLRETTEAHTRARGHPFAVSWVLCYGPWVLELRGESDQAVTLIEEGIRLSRAHGLPFFYEVMGPIWIAVHCIRTGRIAEGTAQLRSGISKWNALGCHLGDPYVKAVLAEGIARGGDLEGGMLLIDECLGKH